jgi:ribosomal protein L11 methyltransferase
MTGPEPAERSGRGARRVVLYRIDAPTAEWDRLVSELHESGTLGVEEREDASPPCLLAYFDAGREVKSIGVLSDQDRRIHVHARETVPDVDWALRWREGLVPRRIGPIWIRPSWCAPEGQPEIQIDPEQAFGSGEHVTTRLALAILLEELRPGDSVLDVGTGSGILALGALRMGARRAVGFDVDPVACRGAYANSRRNELPFELFCGTPDAVRPDATFDLVVANLLFSRLEPWLPRLARHAGRGLILSGHLEGEWPRLREGVRRLEMEPVRIRKEAQTGEEWGACLLAHGEPVDARDLQSSKRSRNVSSST